MPSWAGLDSGASSAFTAGLGICEMGMAILFAFLVSWVMLRRLLTAAGL
jgi:hypothetical protein